ncbi:M20 family metallopeptidase [Robertmurraya massiliosenegalensis]|uniref:M20 family metallopeptidase n=1 Tax=Robertmurraya TaxID=2837507 RepID=UPI0039A65B5A
MIIEFIRSKETEMIELLETLVNIDSGSYFKEGIDEIGTILKKKYEELGFLVKVDLQKERGNHLVIKHKEAKKPKIIVVAHMDTVFPKGASKKRRFQIMGNRAYGPGVVDMKASLVSLLYAMKILLNMNEKAYQNIEIVLNSDEEIGSISSRKLIEEVAKNKDYALIVEPGRKDGSLVSERKGGASYTLKVKGVSSHSGIEHEKGRSAIEEVAYKTIKLHKLTNYHDGITINVGLLKGGTSVNTVAPTAIAGVDVRISKPEQAMFVDRRIREICAKPDVEGTQIEVVGSKIRPPMVKDEATVEMLNVIKGIGNELGIDIKDTYTGGGSDGNLTKALGIPTMDGLGPVGGNAHSEDEYLEIDSFCERTHMLAEIMKQLSLIKVESR